MLEALKTTYLTDGLIVLFTLALLVVTHLMRTLLALRIPSALVYKPTKLDQPPDIMAVLFARADRELTDLGFTIKHWASVHSTPDLPGRVPSLMRLYHHQSKPIVARVAPPHTISAIDQCQVVFLSITTDKTFLATANRQPAIFPRPPKSFAIELNTRLDTIAEQYQAHLKAMGQSGAQWLVRTDRKEKLAWSFRLANRYEKKTIERVIAQKYVKPLAEGGAVPSLGVVLNFIWRYVTGRVNNPPQEKSAIPVSRAAYLFRNWRQTQSQPPTLSSQLGIFLVSALAFALLTGFFWEWRVALLLLVVISFHEAGHWLAMRLLGYRNLQILMLPLVGGVTLGQESTSNATHPVVISLMGPLPGILLGIIVLWLAGDSGGWVFELGILLLAVNYLNLLPILPLDGGQLLKGLIPGRRFNLLITLEFAGVAGLLYLAWSLDSLFVAALALPPLFGGLALIKRKQVLAALDRKAQATGQLPVNEQIVSIIQAIDETDKSYRPLIKKRQEINDILTTQRLVPMSPAVSATFLLIYIASFLLPPIAAYTTSPMIRQTAKILFYDTDDVLREAYDQAMERPLSELVKELAAVNSRLARRKHPQTDHTVLNLPISSAAIIEAERRLGIRLEGEYGRILRISNGFNYLVSGTQRTGHLLFPVEQVQRFKHMLPGLTAKLRVNPELPGEQITIYRHNDFSDEKPAEVALDTARLRDMLVIGSRNAGEYLLLEPPSQTRSATPVLLVVESRGGLIFTGYSSLQDYLANRLVVTQMADTERME